MLSRGLSIRLAACALSTVLLVVGLRFRSQPAALAAPGDGYTTSTFVTTTLQDRWVREAPMSTGRYDFAGAHLPDDSVLAIGGYNGGHLRSTERFVSGSGWSSAGNLREGRSSFSAIALNDGSVLAIGGIGDGGLLNSVERYVPGAGWSPDRPMSVPRASFSAIKLRDGSVLVAGGQGLNGYETSSERYILGSGWVNAGEMFAPHSFAGPAMLSDGSVLIVGGGGSASTAADRYVPGTGWVQTPDMARRRDGADAFGLADGTALVAGYDPLAEQFSPTSGWTIAGETGPERGGGISLRMSDGSLLFGGGVGGSFWKDLSRYFPEYGWMPTQQLIQTGAGRVAVEMNDHSVLVFGGSLAQPISNTERLITLPPNTFTGTLSAPDGWVTSTFQVVVTGSTRLAPLDSVRLEAGTSTGSWVAARAGAPMTLTGVFSSGPQVSIWLHLRDRNGLSTRTAAGRVLVDALPPASKINQLPETAETAAFIVSWAVTDTQSGVAGADIQYRVDEGPWVDWLTSTTTLSATFRGEGGHIYSFRSRATDIAGNRGEFPANAETATSTQNIAATETSSELTTTAGAGEADIPEGQPAE